jgi:hypothetical protein
MKTGFSGTLVISWSQTETDGVTAAPLALLTVGVAWRWTGAVVRVDGPQDVLRLEGAESVAELRRRAARVVRRLIGPSVPRAAVAAHDDGTALADQSFVLTDGRQTWDMTLLVKPETGDILVLAVAAMPPADQDLWVTRVAVDRGRLEAPEGPGGVICFTPGTRLATPHGPRLIEALRQGDLVLTRDNGAQPVLWTGSRRMTGARLHAMPGLRPVRLRAGALGPDRPEPDLLVSPQHRMLLKGRAAQVLFNVDEVLVAAADLVNDLTITVDRLVREVTYIHVLFQSHQILWANGLETESFHPAHAAPALLEPAQRDGLLALFPALATNPQSYGEPARRNLTAPEAAILRHDLRI